METDNVTVSEPGGEAGTLRYVRIASMIIYSVIFVLGTVGNGLVIYVTGFRMRKTVNSVWFLNLALADFLFTAFLVFSIITLYQDHRWLFGHFMCKLNTFVNAVNIFASIFLLMAISLDRCLSTWIVVWAQNKRTVRKAQFISAVIWVTAMICSIPYATFRNLIENDGDYYCGYHGTKAQHLSLYIFRFVTAFLIPFLVILVSYVAIGVRAKRLQRSSKRRSNRIIISVILAFFFCWLPFHVFNFMDFNTNDKPELKNIVLIGGTLVVSLAFLNSCLNPILYVFMCDEFQKKLKQSVCHVLESALTEDHLSFMSSRSLSSHFSRISRKSDSAAPMEGKDAGISLTTTESRHMSSEEGETLSTECQK